MRNSYGQCFNDSRASPWLVVGSACAQILGNNAWQSTKISVFLRCCKAVCQQGPAALWFTQHHCHLRNHSHILPFFITKLRHFESSRALRKRRALSHRSVFDRSCKHAYPALDPPPAASTLHCKNSNGHTVSPPGSITSMRATSIASLPFTSPPTTVRCRITCQITGDYAERRH